MNVQDFLHQLKWDSFFEDQLPFIRIIYLNRGSPSDQNVIAFEDIKAIEGNFLILKLEDNLEEELRIPVHRILQIVNIETNQVFYHKINYEPE